MTYSTSAGSGVPKVGAPDCIDSEDAKLPNTIGQPGFRSCMNAIPANASGERLGGRAGDRHRRHGAREDEGRDDAGLVRARVDLERAEHRRVVGHAASSR